MTYSLSNNCTKNYYNRTLAVQVIVEVVVTWIFLRHSVVSNPPVLHHSSQWVQEKYFHGYLGIVRDRPIITMDH